MKKLFAVLLITIFAVTFAQDSTNRFEQAEQEQSAPPTDPSDEGPGNPGEDPLPINGYIPFLFLAAVGMIAVSQYRKAKISKN